MTQPQIPKNLTAQEVELHQAFFKQCAEDYRSLAEKLIKQLAKHLNQPLNLELPLQTLNPYDLRDYSPSGEMNEWKYFFHGYDCLFTHKLTLQHIEVPLAFGAEFGALDPYFFAKYISSTPTYQPLPTRFSGNFDDGLVIIETMLALGLYEEINANYQGTHRAVISHRKKVNVKVFSPEEFHQLVFNKPDN